MTRRSYHPPIGPAECRCDRLRRGKVSASLRAWVYARDGGACLDCGATKDLTLDHIVPAVIGGREWASNLETRCRSCNSRRKHEWEREHGIHFYPSAPVLDERGRQL